MSKQSMAICAAVVAAASACSSSGSTQGGPLPTGQPSTVASSTTPTPSIDPANFTARVTNPWFPLPVGTTYVYRGVKDGKPARDVYTVERRIRRIAGVPCAVVFDRLYLAGKLEERTLDYYTQDKAGNVWYFGEDTAELTPSGKVKNREGSWLKGVHGAQPGIFMTPNPTVGDSHRQEYYKGQAEDHYQVLSLSAPVTVPYRHFASALLTKEWTPLEPDTLDHKYYVKGIGEVAEMTVRGDQETSFLVSISHA